MSKKRKALRTILGVTISIAILMGVIGEVTNIQVLEVTKKTKASKEAIWQLWSDVPNRTLWDEGLEWAKMNGAFQLGATGELKLKDQPIRKFEIIEYEANNSYTDRFFLPMGGKMDWHHSIKELGNGENEVTFRIEVSGPTSLLLMPIMKMILKEEIPKTVDKLITIAEKSSVESYSTED